MEAWGRNNDEKYDRVQFLCVCVETAHNRAAVVAQAFGQLFHFQSALNGYIPSKDYFPVGYGQLGCSGFIVVDGQGRFISRKTQAYLQYGEAAFGHVERLLDQELSRVLGTDTMVPKKQVMSRPLPLDHKNKAQVKTAIECPPSVGDACMDKEHQECTTVINRLLQDPTTDSLKAVLQVLEDHFRHEEDLLEKHGFGGSDSHSSFSPLVSHRKDHERILKIGRDVLSSIEAC